jgi:hypothetical protein
MLRIAVGVGIGLESGPDGVPSNLGTDSWGHCGRGHTDAFELAGHSLPEDGLVFGQLPFKGEEVLYGVKCVDEEQDRLPFGSTGGG